ncbi:MAG TPA: branched-chain amino acid ABC transporter permease [Stellaceae bacterium]|nr:branched-chain amino acid ABC transporter permease [Stellaceae bacterium]
MLNLGATVLALLIDGVAYGMILFLMSVGLTVTLGVMRIANLAHCAFAMTGGYVAFALIRAGHFTLFTALPIAVIVTMALGAALERTLYRWVYTTGQLGQILMTLGLVFVFVATVNLFFGSDLNALPIPHWMSETWNYGDIAFSAYRAFIIAVSTGLALVLWAILEFTEFGAKLRAAVDNPRMARCVGIDVPWVFSITFAVGCGLAAAAGVLGTQILPLEPWYALEYLVPVLMVVAVGGLGSLKGSFYAALLLGLVDTFGRYYVPAAGAFIIYLAVLLLLLWRPQGVFARI